MTLTSLWTTNCSQTQLLTEEISRIQCDPEISRMMTYVACYANEAKSYLIAVWHCCILCRHVAYNLCAHNVTS